jgi:hypothetical protein
LSIAFIWADLAQQMSPAKSLALDLNDSASPEPMRFLLGLDLMVRSRPP